MRDQDEFEKNRTDQLTSAPGDKWDDDAAAVSTAPRVDITEGEEGRTRIDVADTAAVRPGAADGAAADAGSDDAGSDDATRD